MIVDRIILFPYYLCLKIRHALYDSGLKKIRCAEVPVISIGNVTVGGTGKTPHTEMVLRTLMSDPLWRGRNLAVLSRGYRRKSRGFQNVTVDGSAAFYGDEPLQIKKKFPFVTVAVDKDRVEGCRFLAAPRLLESDKKARRCIDKNIPRADIIVLDDGFQYRKLRPTVSIVLVDYNRPVFKDSLMPLGRLRDLEERILQADIIIVSKCPHYVDDNERQRWRKNLKIGQESHLFFTTIDYCTLEPVYPECENRYLYSKRLVLFSGIANDTPLLKYLSDTYKVVKHLKFPDHHKFSGADMHRIEAVSKEYPTAIITTTEKDCQRVKDYAQTPAAVKERLFRAPIQVSFLGDGEHERFRSVLRSYLTESHSEH